MLRSLGIPALPALCVALIAALLCPDATKRAAAQVPPMARSDAADAPPLLAQAKRVSAALERLGSPLSKRTRAALNRAARQTDATRRTEAIQAALDPYCLVSV